MTELSYTKIRSFLDCPWLFKLRFIEEWKAPPSPQASLGISLHKALELYHASGDTRQIELSACLDTVWERAGYRDAQEELGFYDRAQEILGSYQRDIVPKWRGTIWAIEKDFTLELPDEDVRLMGTIDRIDHMPEGGYCVIEYKTHAEPWQQTRIDDDLQMTIYAHGAETALGLAGETLDLCFFFVAQGRCVATRRHDEHWDKALAVIRDVADLLRSGDYTPDTTHCGGCQMRNICVHSQARDDKTTQ
ncbi:MAG: PD-(D/E)XK nuclease family protein [Elusimicrobiota bacterium]